jgi:NADPH:quinone reductase-like Zn-dependent oxidoreductase
MVIGAGGSVGSVAVSVAKKMGATVTAVCSTKDVSRVRDLGADHVIDRSTTDPLASSSAKFDVIFDTPSAHSFGRCSHLLNPKGKFVNCRDAWLA